ncbi:hypothetical protein GCM10007036_25680 [Alsobacter metallidurans]|uniref:BioF2-like acetyltransferase domain-containing protein n=1 Tax=Alsobacter metallidurans TaxID=340221 RepID=A0A917MHM4_9HYPH|nr:GNAT family N-acetyltransferase [Alsobacter metallidurans]GGH21414.1 hypothetical protein GCM10007036_25680 [Alsobacter metallidurans]
MSAALDTPFATWSRIEVFRSPEDAASAWRALEAQGVATPYQRYDWLAPWYAFVAARKGQTPAIVLVSNGAGAPLALFPLVMLRTGPVRLARFAGGKHCNANMGLFDADFLATLGPEDASTLLFAISEALSGVDLLDLRSQPLSWNGFANPFALVAGARPAEDAHALAFQPGDTADMLVRRLVSKDSRKKLAKKLRWLEAIGPVSLRRAQTEAEVDGVLEAFFRQRAARFKAQHIANPFSCKTVQQFLRSAALAGLDRGSPALELWALWCGDRIAAAFGGVSDGRRLSGAFISFENDKTLMRSSPGEVLTMELAKAALANGLASFDLGMGEDGYKRHVCPTREKRVDASIPITPMGHAMALGLRGANRVREIVKRDVRLLKTVRRVALRFGAPT